MNKLVVLTVFALFMLVFAVSGETQDGSEISVNVVDQCEVSVYDFEQPGYGNEEHKFLWAGGEDYWGREGLIDVVNTGNKPAVVLFNISLFPKNELEPVDLDDQPNTEDYLQNFTLAESHGNEDFDAFKRLNVSFEAAYQPGNYTGLAEMDYVCGDDVYEMEDDREEGNVVYNESYSEDTGILEIITEDDLEGETPDEPGEDMESEFELDLDAIIDYLNETAELDIDTNETEESQLDADAIIEALNATAEVETDINRTEDGELELDAVIEFFNEEGVIDTDFEELEDADLDLDALIEEIQEAAEIDTDVNETDEDAEPREGDDDFPGETPFPGEPEVALEMTPVNDSYEAVPGEFAPIDLIIENVGDVDLEDLDIDPRIDDVSPGWETENAQIGSLDAGENVTRGIFVQPVDDAQPGEYMVPVDAYDENDTRLDIEYFPLEVLEAPEFFDRMRFVDIPRDITIEEGESERYPALIENIGETDLENISFQTQNLDECGSFSALELESLEIDESESVNLDITAFNDTQECEVTVIASSEEGAYTFADMTITVVPEEALISPEQRVPIIAFIWTFMLAGYGVAVRKFDLNSIGLKIPLVVLIAGQTVIILYLATNTYGIIPSGFLPF